MIFIPVLFSDLKKGVSSVFQVYLRESLVLVFKVHFSGERLHLLILLGTTNPSAL